MKNPLLVPEFREMIAENNLEEIKEFCNTTPPSVVADFLGALTPEENREILMHLSSETRSKIFSYFDNDVKLSLIDMFDNDQMVDLIAGMHDDKQLDFLTLLPVDKQKGILDLSRRSLEKEDIELTEVLDKLVKSETPIEEEMTSDELAGEIRPLVKVYKLADGAIKPVDRIEKNTWVNIVNPPRDDLPLLARHFNIPFDFLTASLDVDETARIEYEDNATLIIIKVPFFDEQIPDLMYITLPIGIILVNGLLLTVCPKEEIVLHDFIVGKVKNITTISGHKFILQIIYRSLVLYLQYLKQINNAANMIQKKLEQESKNKQLIKLMNLEKCLVYFTTSLKTNELMLERIQKHGIVQKSDELEDLFEDIVIETRQALEMANVYSDILSGMMDAFASVISNNLNITIKFLTSVTIIITIPATIAAFFGMNVRIPFQEHPDGFIFVIIASVILSIVAVLFFIKKRWL
jgi:magnesium transporter